MKSHSEMGTATISAAASTLGAIAPATIKRAFTEMMEDEAQHVTFFQTALKQAGATHDPSQRSRVSRNPISGASPQCHARSRMREWPHF